MLPTIVPSNEDFVSIFPSLSKRSAKSHVTKRGKSILSGRSHESGENTRRRNTSFERSTIVTKKPRQGLATYARDSFQPKRIRRPVPNSR